MTAQSQADFYANWNRQFGCPEQYDPIVSAAVWTEMLASDPVGATWGTGVRRAPQVPTWGVNQAVVARMQTPFLMVVGAHDKQIVPERIQELYADLARRRKSSSTSPARPTMPCGKRTGCCCSRPPPNGLKKERSAACLKGR